MSELNDEARGRPQAQDERAHTVLVPFPREVVEREVMFDLMALRDERVLRKLSEEDRQRLGDNPVGKIAHLTTAEFAQLGSVTNGCFCNSSQQITFGVTCKALSVNCLQLTPSPGQ